MVGNHSNYKAMKYGKFIFAILLSAMAFVACSDDNGIVNEGVKDVQPQPIADPHAQAINGGAEIFYTQPNDPNVLYVLAEYERNGQRCIERSSLYNNSIKIEGLSTLEPVTATLYTVNYFERRSVPTKVTFTPLESQVMVTSNTLVAKAGFGGIYLTWQNKSKTELSIRLMTKVNGKWTNQEVYFSSMSESRTFREYKDEPTDFGIVIADKWDNMSDTTFVNITPMPEIEAYPLTHRSDIPYDKTSQNAWYTKAMLYDHKNGNNAWLCVADENTSSTFTLDLGAKFILSRVKFWARQRASNSRTRLSPYIDGNVPTVLEFYGSPTITTEQITNRGYWLSPNTEKEFTHTGVEIATPNFTTEWVFLGRMERERLDLLGYTDEQIYNITDQGEEFFFPVDVPAVRYVRVVIIENGKTAAYPVGGVFQIGEMNFWGNNKVPQD